MAASGDVRSRNPRSDAAVQPISWVSPPFLFAAAAALLIAKFEWARTWLVSGAPALSFSVLLGNEYNNRFLPVVPLWTFLTTLNLAYAIAATSWLLHWAFAAGCYPLVVLSCLFQSASVARFARRRVRHLLKESHIFSDKVALFNLPALEIDTEVDGLFVIRGVTVSFSSLTLIAHGIEVGIKVAPDVELAITTDKVTVLLFRKIEIDDVYANLKGGEFELTLRDPPEHDPQDYFDSPSRLLRAATLSAENLSTPSVEKTLDLTRTSPPAEEDKHVLTPASPLEGLESVEKISPDAGNAQEQYQAALKEIEESSLVMRAREKVRRHAEERLAKEADGPSAFDASNVKQLRVAICARLHNKASIAHPPQRSVTVTALQKLSPPHVRAFLHRLPLLLRMLLNPISYFHPVKINSIVAAGSGKWIQYMLQTHVFRHYSERSSDIRRLERRVNAWLTDATFVLQLDSVTGIGHVPVLTSFDIESRLSISGITVHRTLPDEKSLSQVVQLRGADASLAIPIFLLPHHEHLLPAVPAEKDVKLQEQKVRDAEEMPQQVDASIELERVLKDETNIKVAGRASLPAALDQQLLDVIAALVKATKFIEIDKSLEDEDESDSVDEIAAELSDDSQSKPTSPTGLKQSVRAINMNFKGSVKTLNKRVNTGMEKTWRKGIIGGIASDRWIARLVGKVTTALESVRGDIGYSGEIPVALGPYREKAETSAKILA